CGKGPGALWQNRQDIWKNVQIRIWTAKPPTRGTEIIQNTPGTSPPGGFPDIRDSHGAPCTSSGSALKFSASREPLKLWETVSTTATASVLTQDQKAPGTATPEPEPSSISGTAPTWGA